MLAQFSSYALVSIVLLVFLTLVAFGNGNNDPSENRNIPFINSQEEIKASGRNFTRDEDLLEFPR